MPQANTDNDLPGEFQPGPGLMAAEKGVPSGLPAPSRYQEGYTEAQRRSGLRQEVNASQMLRAQYLTDPTDPDAVVDPYALGTA